MIEAKTVTRKNGRIFLGGGDQGNVNTAGTLNASGEKSGDHGGEITVAGASVTVDKGFIQAKSNDAKGGDVTLIGTDFVSAGGQIDVSGEIGGNINITTGGLSIEAPILAQGSTGQGGNISINSLFKSSENIDALLDVSGASGGSIKHFNEQQIITSGKYLALGTDGKGGNIDVTSSDLAFLSATIDASGSMGGGQIRLGGEYQGGKNLSIDEIPNAQTLFIADTTNVTAKTIGADGDGGRIIVWADQKAVVFGDFNATPGTQTGAGGFVEISSGDTLIFGSHVNTGRDDRRGTLLLDPKNITIANLEGTGDTLGNALSGTANQYNPTDITTYGSTSSPSNERFPNAIDNNTSTKFLNFNETGSGFVVTFSSSVVLNNIVFTTANDVPARDPQTVSIYGSNDSTSSGFSLIQDNVSLTSTSNRFTAYASGAGNNFNNGDAFKYYRVVVTAVGNTNCCFQFSEVDFYNTGQTSSLGDTVSSATFANNSTSNSTITPGTITTLLSAANNVVLQANNDITISNVITANNGSGDGGNLTIQAGRSVLVNANITTDNGNLTLIANETVANGAVRQRDSGTAVITLASGTTINVGTGVFTASMDTGAGKTNTNSGDITLSNVTAGSLVVNNGGNTSGSDILDNGVLTIAGTSSFTTSVSNADITLDSANAFTGAVTLNTSGSTGNATIDNGTTALNIAASSVGGNLTLTSGAAAGITDSGTLTVGGNLIATTDANNGIINLGTLAVDGTVALTTNGSGNATAVNDAGLTFAASTVGGNLAATATTGNM
ncbi:MAG: hypothetical protein HN683_04905, partial [Gammaproteobacteria bacterium]|nr:hypothetical protein [Gammaproteobacteria bacterium]